MHADTCPTVPGTSVPIDPLSLAFVNSDRMVLSAQETQVYGSPAPDEHDRQSGAARASDRLALLVAVSQTLASLAPDASDDQLLATLGPLLVPSLGDLCLLYAADASGQLVRCGSVPASGPLAQHIAAVHQDVAPELGIYESLMETGQPVLMPYHHAAGDLAAEHWSFVQAAGLAWELCLPLHGGGDGAPADGLFVIDGTPGSASSQALDPAATLHLAEVLAGLIRGWRVTRGLRARTRLLRTTVEDLAFAGRELAHTLNNSLTMPVGVMELLLDGGPDSPEFREMIEAASSDLSALEAHIRAFQEQMRIHTGGQSRPGQHLPPP